MEFIISLVVILTVVFLAMMATVLWRMSSINKILDSIEKQNPPEPGETRARVWITNDKDYRTFLKLTNSNVFGILSITPKRVSLYSSDTKGKRSVLQIDSINLHIEWLGQKLIPYNLVPWLAIADTRYGNSPIYISSYMNPSMKTLLSGTAASQAINQTKELYFKLTGFKRTGKDRELPAIKLFALEKNPASLSALIITAMLLVYAAIDGLIINPLELVGYQPKILPLIFALFVIVYIVFSFYKIMRKKSVPLPESMVLTFVFCVVLILAAIPVMKRIDTSTAVEPMQNYDYKANEKDVLEPLQDGLPNLPLKAENAYWKQFADDHIFRFPLQKGGFGFWQFDGRELDNDIEAFYANKSEDKNIEQPESEEQ
jgi:FtsH-binding integral membrane protein